MPPLTYAPIAILNRNIDPSAANGLSPDQIRVAYGLNNLGNDALGKPLDGTGQVIAIVDAFDAPTVFADLDNFDQQFSLTPGGPSIFDQYGPASTFLTVVNQNGLPAPLPGPDPSPFPNHWELETALDVQWAHSVAPGAKIILVEGDAPSDEDLIQTAVATAAKMPGVTAVSMSFGRGESSSDPGENSVFVRAGVTFLASTGDNGSGFGGSNAGFPSYSPNVVAVGGTSLFTNADGTYDTETAWSGSGGGTSTVQDQPSYQNGVQNTGQRTVPDVAYLADPATGVAVVDSFGNDGDPNVGPIGGTSLACPMWAGMVALVNQARAANGMTSLNTAGPQESQQLLYGLSALNFNDITQGNNGDFAAGAGYDEVTGLGTPAAGKLIKSLAGTAAPGDGITMLENYAGLNSGEGGGFAPPDTNGAAGTVAFVETANQVIGLFPSKTTSVGKVTKSLGDFFFSEGELTPPSDALDPGLSDPIVVWDDLINRFIVGDQCIDRNFGNLGDAGSFFIAVSKTAAPLTLTSADWNFYSIETTEDGLFGDYPGNFGYNQDAFVFTLNMFEGFAPDNGGIHHDDSGIGHIQITSVNIDDLVNGVSQANLHTFRNSFVGASLRPTVMHDSAAGDPMWFVQEHPDAGGDADGSNIDVVKMTNVLSDSASLSTTTLDVNNYTQPVPPLQPDGSSITTNLDGRIMKVAEMNNTLVAAHAVSTNAGDRDLARWYLIDVSSGTPTLADQGDVTDEASGAGQANVFDVYPTADINADGTIGLTFVQSGTGANQFMSAYVTGRTADDPAGTMRAPVIVPAGTGTELNADTREGDMSAINIDVDGSFWATQEFTDDPSGTFPNWNTVIAHFTIGGGVAPGAPVAKNDSYDSAQGTTLNVDSADGVLKNDTGGGLTAVLDDLPSSGDVALNPNGGFSYTPTDNSFVGDDSFTYHAHNANGDSATATVTIHVKAAPITPTPLNITIFEATRAKNLRVGQITDPSAQGLAQLYDVTLTWPNGRRAHSSVGRVQLNSGDTFDIFGDNSVRYGAPGSTSTVTIDILNILTGAKIVFDSQISVVDAPLVAGQARTIDTKLGRKTNGTIAAFLDLKPAKRSSKDYDVMTINWGDGQVSQAKLAAGAKGLFKVKGNHRYDRAGTYHVKVTIHDKDGKSVTLFATVNVG